MTVRKYLLDLSQADLVEWLKTNGNTHTHVNRIFRYIYREIVIDFREMSELSFSLREKLREAFNISTLKIMEEKVSADRQTRKFLFQLEDGKTIETSMMLYNKRGSSQQRITVCVSSQVGCPIGCSFCATGQQGFERNLRPGEIVEQILYVNKHVSEMMPAELPNARVTNVVFMGMGEPLANYANVHKAIQILNSPNGLGLGVRQITLSSAGLAPQIRQLMQEDIQFELAISLHTVSNELRDRMVPINKKYPVEELMAVCKEYTETTGRGIFFEYALFKDVNDSIEDANKLVEMLGSLKCSVNLITGNPTDFGEYRPSDRDAVVAFQKRLMESGFRCIIRMSKGADIDAGCGQLRSRWMQNTSLL